MTSKTTNKFSPEVRERAVRLVLDHGGGAPCPSGETRDKAEQQANRQELAEMMRNLL